MVCELRQSFSLNVHDLAQFRGGGVGASATEYSAGLNALTFDTVGLAPGARLHLDPTGVLAWDIRLGGLLRHDALKPLLGSDCQQLLSVGKFIVRLQRPALA